jgi:hypothetical protein
MVLPRMSCNRDEMSTMKFNIAYEGTTVPQRYISNIPKPGSILRPQEDGSK